MYESLNVISDDNCDRFKKNLSDRIGEMQKQGLKVEVQYSTDIDLLGRLVFSAMIMGKKKEQEVQLAPYRGKRYGKKR